MGYQIFLVVTIILFFVFYSWYTKIISRKNTAKEALSGIDVQLQKRSNLIPNILKIASKFMQHEKDLIERVTELRTEVSKGYNQNDINSVKSHLEKVGSLDSGMGKLMISVENYPDLKSDATMIQAQKTYNEVEEQIAAARRFYNSAVSVLNNSIEIFPGNIIAGFAKVSVMPFYKTDEILKSPIDANDFL
jgi:LemA protein